MIRQGCPPCVVSYSNLIDDYCKSEKIDKALNIIREIHERGIVPNLVTYNSLINELCLYGRLEEVFMLLMKFRIMTKIALSYLERMLDAGFSANGFIKSILAHFMHRTVLDDASKKLLKRSIVPWHLVKQYRFFLGFEEYHLLQPNASKGLSSKKEMEGDSCMLSKKPNTRSCGVDDNSKVNSVVKLGSTMSEDSIDVLPQDGVGISLNIANHEPRHWSYFQKLARDDLSNKDASHFDEIKISKSMQFADMDVGMVENIRMSDSKYEGMFRMLAHSDDRDSSLVNYDTDTSEAQPPIGFIVHNVARKSPSVIDDSSSPCSTDSIPSVVTRRIYLKIKKAKITYKAKTNKEVFLERMA
ncbi:tetratricopeptide-like helical domain-containing protein [Tanacetum coccineum]